MHTEKHDSKYYKHKGDTGFSLSMSLENNIVKMLRIFSLGYNAMILMRKQYKKILKLQVQKQY